MAMLCGVDVHGVNINAKGGGITDLDTVTGLDNIVKVLSAGYWNGEHWPPDYPLDRGYDGDERQLAKLCKQHSITQSQWDTLMSDTQQLVNDPRFTHLTNVIARLLLSYGHVEGRTLKSLHKSEDMDEGMNTDRSLLMPDGRVLPVVGNLPPNHASEVPLSDGSSATIIDTPTSNGHEHEDYERIKHAAYKAILAIEQAA